MLDLFFRRLAPSDYIFSGDLHPVTTYFIGITIEVLSQLHPVATCFQATCTQWLHIRTPSCTQRLHIFTALIGDQPAGEHGLNIRIPLIRLLHFTDKIHRRHQSIENVVNPILFSPSDLFLKSVDNISIFELVKGPLQSKYSGIPSPQNG